VITSRPFQKGEFVVEYAGELITDAGEAERRELECGGTFMLYFEYKSKSLWLVICTLFQVMLIIYICCMFFFYLSIDATTTETRLGRLFNHSRKQFNVKPKIINIDGQPRVALFAERYITIGEELLWDYGERRKSVLKNNPWLKY